MSTNQVAELDSQIRHLERELNSLYKKRVLFLEAEIDRSQRLIASYPGFANFPSTDSAEQDKRKATKAPSGAKTAKTSKFPASLTAVEDSREIPMEENYVVVAHQNLVEEHGLSESDALKVANAAIELLTLRWPKTKVISSAECLWEPGDDFVWVNYQSRIPRRDFDIEHWDCGATIRPRLYLKIKSEAAKMAGICLPPSNYA